MFTSWYRDQDRDFSCKVSGQDQDFYKTNSGGLDFQDHGLEATRLYINVYNLEKFETNLKWKYFFIHEKM